MLSDGPGFYDPYFVAHGAPAATATVPPRPPSASLRIVRAPRFGTDKNVSLVERAPLQIGRKGLPYHAAVPESEPTNVGPQNGEARVSNFPNPALLGLHLFGDYSKEGWYGATGAGKANWYRNSPTAADTRKPGLLRRSLPWVRSPRVTNWPIVKQVFPHFVEGDE